MARDEEAERKGREGDRTAVGRYDKYVYIAAGRYDQYTYAYIHIYNVCYTFIHIHIIIHIIK